MNTTPLTTSPPDSPRRLKHRAADNDDRISKLPDSILGHIISNLSTTNAMATAVLSKRWKFAWTTIGNLDFTSGQSEEQFVKYVNRVMLLHKPAAYFNKLSLISGRCIPFYVNTWICTAISKNVHELIVRVCISKIPIHVQSCLFSSEMLKSLELSCKICISPEIEVSLPRLETLKLCQVYFPSEEAFSNVIDGCPVLKRLSVRMDINNMLSSGYYIKRVNGVAAFICKISSASLKHVELYARDVVFNALCGVELDAPSLEYIHLYQISSIIVVQPRLEFLCEVDIEPPAFELETRFPNYCNSFVEALEAFSCAKTLYLPEDVIRALSRATIKMQAAFNRLTKLTVHIGQNDWSSLQNLIELSDNLEVLIIDKDADYCYDEDYYHHLDLYDSNWTNPNAVPRCLSNSLKKVLICAYDGNADEQAMVEYIIKNGSVLETMHIRFGATFSGYISKYQLVQLLSTSKKSTTCEIKFADFIDFFGESDAEYFPGNAPNRRSMHYFY